MFSVPDVSPAGPDFAVLLDPSLHLAYGSLALGSAMALLIYPHVLTAALAAVSADALRRTIVALPLWTGVLGLFGALGLAALAAGVRVPVGGAEAAVPLLVADVLPAALTGLVFGALAIGALVPAAVMSVAAGASFTRNIYVEYVHPTATPVTQTRIARVASLLVKVAAVLFVLGLRSRRLHRQGVLAGWVAGMVLGTALVTYGGFSSVVDIDLWVAEVRVYVAVVALVSNLAVALALTPLLDRLRVPRGIDATAATENVDQAR